MDITTLLAVFQLLNVLPAYASAATIDQQTVITNGKKIREKVIEASSPSDTAYIDTYVYTTNDLLATGEINNNYFIVKKLERVSEDFPYVDKTLSIYGQITVTTTLSGNYKKISKVTGNWISDDNQVGVIQQTLRVTQNGQTQAGSFFIDTEEASFGSDSSWTFSSQISAWPYIEDSSFSICLAFLEVTIKDLISGDTWKTSFNANV